MPRKEKSNIAKPKPSGTTDIADAHKILDSFLSLISPPRILQVRSLPRLLFNLIDEATRITGAERGTIYLADYTKDILTSYIGHGLAAKEITLPIGTGIAGHVVKTGEIHNCKDAYL